LGKFIIIKSNLPYPFLLSENKGKTLGLGLIYFFIQVKFMIKISKLYQFDFTGFICLVHVLCYLVHSRASLDCFVAMLLARTNTVYTKYLWITSSKCLSQLTD